MNTEWKKICLVGTLLLAQMVAVNPTNIMAASIHTAHREARVLYLPKRPTDYGIGSSGSTCSSANGWHSTINGDWIFLVSGVKQTGLVKIRGKIYYLGKKGVMQTGRVEIGGDYYYFGSDGALLHVARTS